MSLTDSNNDNKNDKNNHDLRGQRLSIPDLRPAFATWKRGVNPLHARVRPAVDARLEPLIEDTRALAKVRLGDIGLFAAGWFPDAAYEALETAAFYCVWLFLWDDAIDGGGGDDSPPGGEEEGGEKEGPLLAAEEYCRRSVAFVRFHLALDEPAVPEPAAPTKVCESFAEVGRRIRALCGPRERAVLFEHLREYMEGCVVEYRWRLSGRLPTVDEFYSWRLRTSSVDAMLDLCRILNRISVPRDVLESAELAAMALAVNKLLILINELFSLKKELKDGAFANLLPIKMRALGLDLEGAARSVVHDIYGCIRDFDRNAEALRASVAKQHDADTPDQLERLIGAYQAVATSVLNFSIQSPRYGLLEHLREDGSFVVDL